MSISEVDLAYIAGILEGEGSFTLRRKNVVVRCDMTDSDIILRLKSIVGFGHVNSRAPAKPGYKPVFMYTVSGKPAISLCNQIYKFMGNRRQSRITEILKSYYSLKRLYTLQNIVSGEIQKTQDLSAWVSNCGMKPSQKFNLLRTMTGERQSCHGWKIISVIKPPA